MTLLSRQGLTAPGFPRKGIAAQNRDIIVLQEMPAPCFSTVYSEGAPWEFSSVRPEAWNTPVALTMTLLTQHSVMNEVQLDLVGGQTMWILSNLPLP